MNDIFTKFLGLKPEKQERIINAAIKEFAQKGFKNAATDEIVKTANISKGALFHYFNSKKDLFLFLYDQTLEIVMKEFFGKIDLSEKDILKRLRQVLSAEFMLINKYPDMFDFIKVVNFEDSDEVREDLESRNNGYIADGYSKVLEDIDTSKFKDNIDIGKAIEIIFWSINGFSEKVQKKVKTISLAEINVNEVLSELDAYIELLKSSFYK